MLFFGMHLHSQWIQVFDNESTQRNGSYISHLKRAQQ